MQLNSALNNLLVGGQTVPPEIARFLKPLAGLTFSILAGATAGTKMNVPAIRVGDNIVAALIPPAVTTNAVAAAQTITVDAAGGAFTITWGGQTTSNLAYNISAADMQTALEALSNINPGDVVVTGGPGASGGGTAYTLTWNASLGAVAAPTTTVTGTGHTLTGGASTAVVGGSNGTTAVQGAWADDADNMTIQSTKAAGTVTFASAIAGNTFAVNGVTYTVRAAADCVDPTDLRLEVNHDGTGGNRSNAAMADAAVVMVNSYEARYTGAKWNDPAVFASSTGLTGVVTFTAIREGAGNAPVVTGTVTTLAAANSGTAAATLTAASAVNGNTFVVNGVTFTVKTTPVALDTECAVKGTDALQAMEITRCLNAYATKYSGDWVATCTGLSGVVTIAPKGSKSGNIIPLAGTVTTLAASGAALSGGTATGGVKSTTSLTGKSVLLVWSNVDLV